MVNSKYSKVFIIIFVYILGSFVGAIFHERDIVNSCTRNQMASLWISPNIKCEVIPN